MRVGYWAVLLCLSAVAWVSPGEARDLRAGMDPRIKLHEQRIRMSDHLTQEQKITMITRLQVIAERQRIQRMRLESTFPNPLSSVGKPQLQIEEQCVPCEEENPSVE